MRTVRITLALCALTSFPAVSFSEEAPRLRPETRLAESTCEQVISCGLKDGKWKQYPTPCAARDDGATNITPKTGPTCEVATK